jgi:hypothetical protein
MPRDVVARRLAISGSMDTLKKHPARVPIGKMPKQKFAVLPYIVPSPAGCKRDGRLAAPVAIDKILEI